ncbi:hypothetical protein [Salipiger sp. PrR003]|uniref:hypothetical protein n=1 Tax=Salipiger sp. PrR003 TaxID=2706776 RepID=UPI0013DB58FC|nr:hypothetical protein [Salipiger sp. PrR003]NDV52938.1 hypothetical protein [Salipiger sp. PrR003]
MTHRTPLRKAELTGAASKNPQRFRDRKEPHGGPVLGRAPTYFNKPQRAAWSKFKAELPWLVEADRAMVEMASIVRSLIEDTPAAVSAAMIREYRQQLSALGATPTARSKVNDLSPPAEEVDPWAQFDGGMQ